MPRVAPSRPVDRTADLRVLLVCNGDARRLLAASPVAGVLREACPHATIHWLVDPAHAALAQANPAVHEVLVLERYPQWCQWLREGRVAPLLREVHAFGAALQGRGYDIALDLMGGNDSAFFTRLTRAPRRLGALPGAPCSRVCLSEFAALPAHPTRLAQASLTLLAPLGIEAPARPPVLELPAGAHEAAHGFLAHHGLDTAPYAVCCLPPSDGYQRWQWGGWHELATLLLAREGLRTIFIGDADRRADALSLVDGNPAKPLTAIGHLDLAASAALAQRARLVVGLDAGLTYAGLPAQAPTLILFGPSEPAVVAEEPHTAVCYHPLPCSPCRHAATCRHHECFAAIPAPEVAATAHLLLEQSGVTV